MNWEHTLIRLAVVFVIIVLIHAIYRFLTGNSLNDDARWYEEQKREESGGRRKAANALSLRLPPHCQAAVVHSTFWIARGAGHRNIRAHCPLHRRIISCRFCCPPGRADGLADDPRRCRLRRVDNGRPVLL